MCVLLCEMAIAKMGKTGCLTRIISRHQNIIIESCVCEVTSFPKGEYIYE